MDKFSIRKKQLEVATSMLNLNSSWQPDWKFLIYDTIGQNIIAPLLPLDKLKSHNITDHLPIDKTDREPIPGISAVYFVMPTDKNIDQICKDLSNHLYDSYYLNFISPLSRSKLEMIADAALMSDSSANIKKVYDQYLNFIALEDDLFILREAEKHTVSFHAINRTDATETEINAVVDRIVDGLFSILITLNIIPYIRCPHGGAAVYIAEKLTKKIRESLRDTRNSLFDNKSESRSSMSFQRPLLTLIDRTVDMSTPLHHSWTYQALCHDLLNTELNKVKVVDEQNKPKIYDLDPTTDKFWIEQRGNTFPDMAESVHKGFSEYKRREDEINSLRSGIGLEGGGPGDEISGIHDATTKLTNAAKSLPELAEHKRNLSKHTTISTCLLEEIKNRKLDNFFELEEKIMNQSLIDREQLDEMLTNHDYGHASDKYRLFLISYICDNPNLSDDEAEKFITTLEGFGCNRAAFNYVKRWKTISRINVENLQSSLRSSSSVLKTASMFVMEGVKNLVLKEHYLPLTKIVDSLMDANSKSSKQAEKYAFFDPKASDDRDSVMAARKSFQQAIVFIVGGGNYMEYQNLVDYCKSKNRNAAGPMGSKHVIYGSTDLMNATQFLSQLEQMD